MNINFKSVRQQNKYLEFAKQHIGQSIEIVKIWGDPRTAWRKFHNDKNYCQIGRSNGSRGNNNYHSTWAIAK